MKKRLLSLLLALTMACLFIPAGIFAEGGDEVIGEGQQVDEVIEPTTGGNEEPEEVPQQQPEAGTEGSEEGTEGSEEVTEGSEEVTEGSEEVTEGSEEVTEGSEEVTEGSEEVTEGSEEVTEGSEEVTEGSDEVTEGSEEVTEGSEEVTEGSEEVTEGSEEVTEGSEEVTEGSEEVTEGSEEVTEGSEEVTEGSEEVTEGSEEVTEGSEEVTEGSEEVTEGSETGTEGSVTGTEGSADEEATEEPSAEEPADAEDEEEAEEEPAPIFDIRDDILVKYNGEDEEVTVPNGIKEIGQEAFYANKTIRKVILPDSVELINNRAFAECSNLEKVVIGSESKLETIGMAAFRNDTKLDISFAANVKFIVDNAFDGIPAEETAEDISVVAEPDAAEPDAAEPDAAEPDAAEPDAAEPDAVETEPEDVVELEPAYATATVLEITGHPQDVEAVEGAIAEFTVIATGEDLSYQWQYFNGTRWYTTTKIDGYDTDTLKVEAKGTRFGQKFRCIVTDGNGATETSNPATLTEAEPAVVFEITGHPQDVEAVEGSIADFTVTATGEGLTYQWQYFNGTRWYSTTKIDGYNTDTLHVEAKGSRFGQQFRCIVTDMYGAEERSNPATLTEAAPAVVFEITGHPQDVEAVEGTVVEFKVTATGEGLNYQWQYFNGKKWYNTTKIDGYDTDTLQVEAKGTRFGQKFRCVVTDMYGAEEISNDATLTEAAPAVVFEITGHPQDVEAVAGTVADFTVIATGEGLTYQWQYFNGTKWYSTTKINGYDTDTLHVDAKGTRFGQQFRCIVTDKYGATETSNPATLTEAAPAVVFEITGHPQDVEAVAGTVADFTVTATGEGLTYQWQYFNGTKWYSTTKIDGYNTDTLQVEAKGTRFGQQFRCIVTDINGESKTSEAATLTEAAPAVVFEITGHPQDAEAVEGSIAEFTVTATGEGLTYQWQYFNGTKWYSTTKIDGYNTDTLQVEAKGTRFGQQFRCIVTDINGESKTSEAATLTEAAPAVVFEITEHPQDVEARTGTVAEFKVTATGEGLIYQWQYFNGTKWYSTTKIDGYNTDTLQVEAKGTRFGQQFRCIVTDINGESKTSDAATLTQDLTIVIEDASGTFTYEIIDGDKLRLVSYEGSASSLVIPETVEGMTVTEIGEEAFMGNTALESIDLPDTITAIKARAFKNCVNLSSMN